MNRKDWLRETLSTVDEDIFLFLHHNIVDTKIKPVDQIKLLDTSLLREVCNEFKDKIRFIFQFTHDNSYSYMYLKLKI